MNLFLLVLVIMSIYMTVRDYKVIKRHKSYKAYSPLIGPVYDNSTDEFLKLADEYIESEKLDDFKNKARILKLFSITKENKDGYKEVIDEIDLRPVLLNKKGQIDKTKHLLNCDSLFWLLLSSIEADVHQNNDLINALSDKLKTYDDVLSTELYFKMATSYLEVAKGNKESLNFFKRVLEGDYSEYTYGKDLIGIFKKVAAAILVYKGEEIAEEDLTNLKSFTSSQAGSFILKELNLYDLYVETEPEDEE